jgi:hypothetical protein
VILGGGFLDGERDFSSETVRVVSNPLISIIIRVERTRIFYCNGFPRNLDRLRLGPCGFISAWAGGALAGIAVFGHGVGCQAMPVSLDETVVIYHDI